MTKIRSVIQRFWEFVREFSGENAYARYAATVLERGGVPLTPKEFYILKLERQYSRPSRCC